jgi:CheY-like chemotaxis protein
VDDDDSVRTLLQVGLERSGFRVWVAASAAEAVDVYRQHAARIAVVLLDVRMPGQDGPATLRALQQLDPDVYCCFMSGHTGDYSEESLRELGAAQVFTKPFHLADIVPILWQLAARRPSDEGPPVVL